MKRYAVEFLKTIQEKAMMGNSNQTHPPEKDAQAESIPGPRTMNDTPEPALEKEAVPIQPGKCFPSRLARFMPVTA